ncbi:unnamed protein product [Angiostrongylus costaricensis]|uniref:Rod_C domain-containing protein n=1 Tax=Angiostrongylus costaricensis TaxID=334426 RepID=A0A0R3Q0R9_ANGCS|nr:unnamed protein product [Angiostrongylus costaricensis]
MSTAPSIASGLGSYVHHVRHSKRASKRMMANPYACDVHLDELGPDHTIIDFAFISEENFLLVVLLASSGDVQTYCEVASDKARKSLTRRHSLCCQYVEPVTVCLGPEATFAAFGLSDGDILLTPIKTLMDVPWGASRWLPENRSVVISIPSSGVNDCLLTPTCMRCFVTKNPPRPLLVFSNKAGTIMFVDLRSRKCVAELNAPQSIHEVEILQSKDNAEVIVEPASSHLSGNTEGVVLLNSVENFAELYDVFPCVGAPPKKRFKIPPETWMVHYTDSVLFTVSKQAELNAVRLEFSIVKGACGWRPLGFVPLSLRRAQLPSCLLINERGLLSIIPSLVSARCGKKMTHDDLSRILSMAKTVGLEIDELVNIFANHKQEEQLLPEILRIVESDGNSSLRKKVVELYVRRSEVSTLSSDGACVSETRLAIDSELSAFLSRHVNVDKGARICAEAQLWRSATLLALRQRTHQEEVLRVLICNGAKNWSTAVPSVRSLMMTCAANLDWAELRDEEVGVLVSLLCDWQAALNSISYHESCLRLSVKYMST